MLFVFLSHSRRSVTSVCLCMSSYEWHLMWNCSCGIHMVSVPLLITPQCKYQPSTWWSHSACRSVHFSWLSSTHRAWMRVLWKTIKLKWLIKTDRDRDFQIHWVKGYLNRFSTRRKCIVVLQLWCHLCPTYII